jgi:CRP-like cAMP-binding protein
MVDAPLGYKTNRLLAALPATAFSSLEGDLKRTSFALGTVLQEPGSQVERIYFPLSGMLSLLIVTEDGSAIETATVGREGAVGIQRALTARHAFTRAVVQVAGQMSHISAAAFHTIVAANGAIKDIIAAYTEIQWNEAQQGAACNAVHIAEARLARWLLQTRDRLDSNEVPLTQEFLAQMLGVRRTTVTLIARSLQAAKLIRYKRGHIHIIDGAGLEAVSCECYRAVRAQNLLPRPGIEATQPVL